MNKNVAIMSLVWQHLQHQNWGTEMALLDQDTVLTIFGEHVYGARSTLLGAWDEYRAEYSERLRQIHGRTTRANCVHDLAKDGLSRFVQGKPELRVETINRMFVLIVQNRLVCRIKKLDRLLQPSNLRTKQVLAFRGQQCLPGLSDTCNLEIGYQLDRTEQQIAAVHLVCPNGSDTYFWAAEIAERAVMQTFGDLFPIRTPEPEQEEDALIVRPKRDDGVVVPLRRDVSKTDDEKP